MRGASTDGVSWMHSTDLGCAVRDALPDGRIGRAASRPSGLRGCRVRLGHERSRARAIGSCERGRDRGRRPRRFPTTAHLRRRRALGLAGRARSPVTPSGSSSVARRARPRSSGLIMARTLRPRRRHPRHLVKRPARPVALVDDELTDDRCAVRSRIRTASGDGSHSSPPCAPQNAGSRRLRTSETALGVRVER